MRQLFIICILLSLLFSCRKEVSSDITIDFSYEVVDSNYSAPVHISFTNLTKGAQFYKWSFQGGSPRELDKKDPGTILFDTVGTITIKLEAWNDEQRKEKEITIHLDSAIRADFTSVAITNNFGPTDFTINSIGTGATQYKWTFQNGSPATATGKNPGPVHYDQPGTYKVFLEASNERGRKDTISKWINVLPALAATFDIDPSFDDEDYEAPLLATLNNKSICATSHKWTATGGTIDKPTDSVTTIRFSSAGTYNVTYEASNGKQSQTVTRTITVKPSSGLRTFTSIKLGINTAHPTLGCFFSTSLRKTFTKTEVNSSNGNKIDLVFFGLNESFTYNRFVSPDSAGAWTFDAIPGARPTVFINNQESTGVQLSAASFDNISTGAGLDAINVTTNPADIAFNKNLQPRIVLFKNADGKKGAIKIKEFVQTGLSSYIICDIKIQKE